MTATMHRIGAGDGFRYYTAMTASADERRAAGEKLGDYYVRSGNPAGEWMGTGITALGVSGEVTEDQLGKLLGLGRHPLTGEQLGSRYRIYATVEERIEARVKRLGKEPSVAAIAKIRIEEERKGERQAVAGFDCTFSPVKSVSVAWGLASPEVAAQLQAAHDAAVASSVAWIEREVVTARTGTDGIAHVDIGGVIAAGFVHRTSRVGDPDLHTHVVISNKVQAVLPDGSRKWLTLDSRSMYKANVTFSERYNRLLEDEVGRRLGWEFGPRSDQGADAMSPIRELTRIPEPLIAAFSRRRQQIEVDYGQRLRDYRTEHGREPSKQAQYAMAQAACLANRPPKLAGSSEVSERAAWDSLAQQILTSAELVQLRDALGSRTVLPRVSVLSAEQVQSFAVAAVAAMEESRSAWTERHLASQIQRQTAGVGFVSDTARDEAVEAIIAAAHGLDGSILVSAPEAVQTPRTYRRANGRPVWEAPASLRYSTTRLLDAEERLVLAARERVPVEVDSEAMKSALRGNTLAPDQLAAVQSLASSGKRVQLLIGPAGAGKTTTMRSLVQVWQRAAGRPVRGLAPTAGAASVLRTETGMSTTATIDLWATKRAHGHADATFARGELIIVDEAGMAGTLNLDRIVAAAREDGAQVVLVGDPAQLSAVASGGAMRLIQHDVGAAELCTIWRFAQQWEAEASVGIRHGNAEALEPYFAHDRITHGTREAMSDEVYAGWNADRAAGREAVMLAVDNTTVQQLSERAQYDRIASGEVDTSRNVRLRNGSTAHVGDQIVTRRNDRTLQVGADFVKNGDVWHVEGITDGGDLTIRGQYGRLVLPAGYAQQNVELGYAMTVHRAQGMTISSAHVVVDDAMSRELLYVAMTRGREQNSLYTISEYVLDAETERPADPNQPARAVLSRVLQNCTAAQSATEAVRDEQEREFGVGTQLQRYRYVQSVEQSAEQLVTDAVPAALMEQVSEDPQAWEQLSRHLEWIGVDALPQLRAAAGEVTADLATADTAAAATRTALGRGNHAPARPASAAQQTHAATRDTHQHVAELLLDRLATAEERSGGDWFPRPGTDTADYRVRLVDAVRARAEHLGRLVADERPAWSRQLEAVPTEPQRREEWIQRAGRIAAYREAFEVTSAEPLGPEPREQAQRIIWSHARTAITDPAVGVGVDTASVSRWRELAEGIEPGLTRGDRWTQLSGTLDRLDAQGVDVQQAVRTAAAAPLPKDQVAAVLRQRLIRQYPGAVEQIRAPQQTPSTRSNNSNHSDPSRDRDRPSGPRR